MNKREIVEIEGIMGFCDMSNEPIITVFEEIGDFINEETYYASELFEGFEGKMIKITIEHENKEDN